MKIKELFEEKKKKHIDPEDVETPPEDPDKADVPHIIMQLLSAVDVDGNKPIKFQDQTEAQIPLHKIALFLKKYMTARPNEKEAMQQQASQSLSDFNMALHRNTEKPKLSKIKGDRYMSHFSGDID